MPPKGWRKTAQGFQPTNSSGVTISDHKVHGIEDLLLPRAAIVKVAKQVLPENSPMPKDAATALLRSTTMFISYITSEANLIARQENRKTVNQADILKALELNEFSAFVGPVVELSSKMASRKKEMSSDSAQDAGAVDEDGDETLDPSEDLIEEDAEPEQELPPSDQKKPKVATREASSEGDIAVDP